MSTATSDTFGDSEGIAVIDVTKPEAPTYCFVRYSFSRRIYTAARYLRTYYTKRDCATLDEDDNRAPWNSSCDEAVVSLRDVPLLSPDVLAETWPRWFEEIGSDPHYKSRPPIVEDAALVRLAHVDIHAHTHVRSQRQLDSTLQEWLGDPNSEELDAFVPTNLAGVQRAKATLRSISPLPNRALEFLGRLAQFECRELGGYVDLSGFDISYEIVLEILSQCDHPTSLNVSCNPCITIDGLAMIIGSMPALRRVNFMSCPTVPEADLCDFVRLHMPLLRGIEAIHHPYFLTTIKPRTYPASFTFVYLESDNLGMSRDIRMQDASVGVSLPLFTPSQVLQALMRVCRFSEIIQFSRLQRFGALEAYLAFSHGSVDRDHDGKSPSNPVISLPDLAPTVSTMDEGTWLFFLTCTSQQLPQQMRFIGSSVNLKRERGDFIWGFMKCMVVEPTGSKSTAAPDEIGNMNRGKIYDLRGFLRCMADEGRPLPNVELVEEAEHALYERSATDGSYVRPFLDDLPVSAFGVDTMQGKARYIGDGTFRLSMSPKDSELSQERWPPYD